MEMTPSIARRPLMSSVSKRKIRIIEVVLVDSTCDMEIERERSERKTDHSCDLNQLGSACEILERKKVPLRCNKISRFLHTLCFINRKAGFQVHNICMSDCLVIACVCVNNTEPHNYDAHEINSRAERRHDNCISWCFSGT
jgi:hypothetical protein